MNGGKVQAYSSILIIILLASVIMIPYSMGQKPVDKIKDIPAGWTDDINLSGSAMGDSKCSISVSGDDVHVVWRHTYVSALDYEVVYTKSNDGGMTWTPFINISNSLIMADDSDIAAFNDNIHVVWENITGGGIDEIYYRNSPDGGLSWNPEKQISAVTGAFALNPHVFVNNSNVHILWHDFRVGTNGQVFYRRSLDGGITWDDGQGIDQDRQVSFSPADIGGVNMAGEGSNFSAVWYDERDGDWEIYWMISKDNGFTWEDGLGTPDTGRKLTDSTIDSTDPAIAIDGSDIHIVWVDESWPGPEYRLYYRNSTDNGVTWNAPQLLTGPVPGINSPDIDVEGNNVSVVWDDERDDGTNEEIYYKNSTDGGISWSADTRLTYNISGTSYWPRVGVNGSNIHVTWYDNRDGNSEIYYKRFPDFPPDSTPPAHTNETPPPDSYRDAPGTNISVHVTDPSGVNETTIQLYVNGSLITYTSTPITDGFNVSYESPSFDPGIVECRIVADDNLSNTLDFTWNFTVLALYEIQLQEGWNLISVPHVQVDTAIKEVLRDIDGKWNYIQWYDASDPVDKWKTNATFKPQQLNDLFVINRTMAFWINITELNVNLTVRGLYPGSTTIPLYRGWNLVGYPSLDTETVGNALFGTTADRVEVCDISEPYNIREVGPEYLMKPGEGYWVHVAADSVWVIDW